MWGAHALERYEQQNSIECSAHEPSAQQVALGSGQHAQVKQKPKNSRRQQQVLPAAPCIAGRKLRSSVQREGCASFTRCRTVRWAAL